MIFYFTATGNSLYAAKQLDDERFSIPQVLHERNRHYKADRIGIVCPLFEFDIPPIVKDFIRGTEFETEYFYIVVTFGCHDGGVAERVQRFLKSVGKKADYINTIIMVDNALLVFDMDQQRRIDPEKKVDEHLAAIRQDIENRRKYIQEARKEETDFYNGYMHSKEEKGPMYLFPLYKVTENCIGCGTCSKVCPRDCISLIDGKVTYDYTECINCMACVQACPVKAIQFAGGREVNPQARYRNPNVTLAEIIRSNQQKRNGSDSR